MWSPLGHIANITVYSLVMVYSECTSPNEEAQSNEAALIGHQDYMAAGQANASQSTWDQDGLTKCLNLTIISH